MHKYIYVYHMVCGLTSGEVKFFTFQFISKANIKIAETNINYKTYVSIMRLSSRVSEDNGTSV